MGFVWNKRNKRIYPPYFIRMLKLTLKTVSGKIIRKYDENSDTLDFSYECLLKMPHINFTKLQNLKINNNFLKSIRPEIGLLINLLYLDLSNNSLKLIPHEIKMLVNLKHLDLYSNQLKQVPLEICAFSSGTCKINIFIFIG